MVEATTHEGSLVGATLAGKYRLTGLLGEGAMGAVYSAETPEGRVVAVKTLLSAARQQLGQEAISRFRREAEVSGIIKNPHVVEVLDAGHDQEADVAFMVMELMTGEDLEQLVVRTGALRPEVAVRLAMQACRGLAAAHAKNVVHRDIKPANIFLHREGERVIVKVCDFGVAKEQQSTEAQGLTVTGSVLGSPLYMSPEQLLNAKKVDHRADIWGLAMSLFDAVAGEPALKDATTLPALVMALARQDVRTLAQAAPWIDPALSTALEGALRRDPEKRYGTMQQLLDALTPFSGGSDEVTQADLVPIDPVDKARVVAPQPANPDRNRTQPPPAGGSSTQNPERHVGQTLAKRYQLLRLIRQGADGWIYEAKTANSGRPCQIRMIPRSIVGSAREAEALVERARAARDLRHPNLIRVLDAGIDPISTLPYVVIEPNDGKSLATLLEERGKLPEAMACGIALHVARALAAVHSIGSHHGAVRPTTVLISDETAPDGKPAMVALLAGWGEAKLSFEPLPAEGVSANEVSSFARAMAPEQARESNKEVDARTDAWGLSLCLYEALAGRHPLGAYRAMGDLILAICVQEIPKLSLFAADARSALVDLLARGLQRNPQKRPASMADFQKVLAPLAGPMANFPPDEVEHLAGMPAGPKAPLPVHAPPDSTQGKSPVSFGLMAGVAVVLALLVVGVVAVMVR